MLSSRASLWALAALYAAQGLPYGFFTQAVPALLRAEGASLPKVALSYALFFPWALKFLWAPWVERVAGPRRRGALAVLQALTAAAMLALALVDPADGLTPVMVGLVVVSLFSATQDIVTDGLAVQLPADTARASANAVQVGAYRVGMIIGGGAVLMVLERIGWAWSFVGMAAALLLLALPAWRAGAAVTVGDDALTQEPVSADVSRPGRGTARDSDGTPSGGRDPEDDAGTGAIGDWMRRRRALAWLGVLVAVKLGDALSGAMVRPMLVDAGYDLAAIGATLGVAGSSAALVGALTGGAVVQRIGRTRALVGFGVLQTLVLAGWAFVGARPAAATVLGLTVAENLVGTVVTVALFTAMMDAVRPRFGGSDYTVQASTVVVVQGVGALASGWMAEALGYPAHFGLAALLALGGVAAVWRFGEGRRVWG